MRPGPKSAISRELFVVDGVFDRDAYDRARKKANGQRYSRKHASAIAERGAAWRKANPEKYRAQQTKSHEKIKNTVFAMFGNKCTRCGFDDQRALQIDHIDGAKEPMGHKHRSGNGLYGAIHKGLKSPEEFQLLCANCNWIKRYEQDEVRKNRKRSSHV